MHYELLQCLHNETVTILASLNSLKIKWDVLEIDRDWTIDAEKSKRDVVNASHGGMRIR